MPALVAAPVTLVCWFKDTMASDGVEQNMMMVLAADGRVLGEACHATLLQKTRSFNIGDRCCNVGTQQGLCPLHLCAAQPETPMPDAIMQMLNEDHWKGGDGLTEEQLEEQVASLHTVEQMVRTGVVYGCHDVQHILHVTLGVLDPHEALASLADVLMDEAEEEGGGTESEGEEEEEEEEDDSFIAPETLPETWPETLPETTSAPDLDAKTPAPD